MKSTIASILFAALLVGTTRLESTFGQAPPPGYGGGVQYAGGAPPYENGAQFAACDACDAYGEPIGPGCAGGACGAGGGAGGMFAGFGAYGADGGYDQCGPHYFDLSADALFWTRDATGPDGFFSSEGSDGPRALSIAGLDFSEEVGYRLTGRFDLGPATIVEATYFGGMQWSSSQSFDQFPIFSLYTDFGTNPFPPVAQNMYPDTENATLHRISYGSELHNAEINWRQYWVADCPALTGTYLLGARYVRLTEDFLFQTETAVGAMDNLTDTENDLVGFQAGGDLAYCILPGLRLVAEGKAGIFNNRVKQRVNVVATSQATQNTTLGGNTAAFVGEASFGFVADILPSFSIRGGYQVLYLDSVALAGDNFNRENPFDGPRNLAINAGSSINFNGAYGGLEFIW